MFPRNFGRSVGRITTSHYHDDALADALAEARRCVGKARACTEAIAAAAKITSGFPEIEAKPAQIQQWSQSHREADGYISIRARFLANAIRQQTTLPNQE